MPRCISVVHRRLLTGLCVVATLVAGASLAVQWREMSRPGMRRYLRGMELLSARYPKGAEQEWLLGIQEDPTEYHCYEQLGDYYTTLQQFEQAVECYTLACRLAPRDGSLQLRLAAGERKVGRMEQARAAARRAAELLPNSADAVGLYGILLAESRNRPAALRMLRRAHALSPENRRYFLQMVQAELDTLNYVTVERELRPFLRRHPGDADANFLMAVVYNQKPRTPENLRTATTFAERARTDMPSDPRAHALLGQLYLDAGRTEDALRVFTEGRAVAPNGEGILRGLMVCYQRLGRKAEMEATSATFREVLERHDRIEHLTHAMSRNPRDTVAGLELARLVEADGQHTKARAYYEQIVRQSPDDPRTRRELSRFYGRMGRPDRAKRALDASFVP